VYTSAKSDFALGHFGKSLLWGGVESLGLYLLVSVHGITPALAGTVLFASMIWNALLDGAFGLLVGRQWLGRERLAAATRAAIFLAGISFALLPIATPLGSWWPISLLFVTRSAFSLIDVQHNLASAPLADRTGHLPTARLRSLLATLAAATIAFAAVPMIQASGESTGDAALLIAALGVVSCFAMVRIPRLLRHLSPGCTNAIAPGFSRAILGFAVLVALGFAGLGAVPKALLQIDFGSGWMAAAVLPILTLARLAANPVSTLLSRSGGILTGLRLALLSSGVTAAAMPLLGVHPLADVTLIAVFGVSAGAVAVLSWAHLTEILAFKEGRSSPVGNFTMFSKFGLSASALLAGFWLEHTGGGRSTVTPDALLPLCSVVLMCCVISAMLLGGLRGDVRPNQSIAGA
jgi:Na+/melibiose symporter-like transporter